MNIEHFKNLLIVSHYFSLVFAVIQQKLTYSISMIKSPFL